MPSLAMQVPITLPTESVCLGACSTDTVTRERMRVEMAGTGQGKDGDCSTVRGPPSTVAPRPIQQYVRWKGMVNTRWVTTVAEWMGGAAHTWSAGRDAKQVAHTQAQNLEPPKKMPTTTLVKRKEREFCCEPCLQKVVGSVSSARLVGIVIAEKEREQLVARHDYKHGSSSSTA
jgi:hypothetical protein